MGMFIRVLDYFKNLDPPRLYTKQELVDFEERMGIILPEAYRDYLLRVGAGLYTRSKVCCLEEWCQPNVPSDLPDDFLRRNFPHTTKWDEKTIHDHELGWKSPYFDEKYWTGSMRIVNTGCEGYLLLVVTGPERGTIWIEDRACSFNGIYPYSKRGKPRVTIEEFLGNY